MKRLIVIAVLLASVAPATAQKVITVNPDGTGTVQAPQPSATAVVRSGRTTTYIGPNGTTTIVRSGGTTVILNGR